MRDRIHSFNFIIERELPGKFTGQVGYVGTRAVGQMGFININAGAPGTGTNGRPLFAKFGLTTPELIRAVEILKAKGLDIQAQGTRISAQSLLLKSEGDLAEASQYDLAQALATFLGRLQSQWNC